MKKTTKAAKIVAKVKKLATGATETNAAKTKRLGPVVEIDHFGTTKKSERARSAATASLST
jgi:hypothetical protein